MAHRHATRGRQSDVAISGRLSAPPDADAEKVEARQQTLPPRLQRLIQRAGDGLTGPDPAAAQSALAQALAVAPGQPDVLRLYALLLERLGNHPAAVANFEAALKAAPDDAVAYAQYARACEDAGDLDSALALRQRAVQCLPDSPLAWIDLGEHLFTRGSVESSLAALERGVELAPDYAPGLFKLGNAYVSCGRVEEGAAMTRRALALDPTFAAAWLGLADIKTVPITDAEIAQMRGLLSVASSMLPSDRMKIQYALGLAYERAGRYPEAFRMLVAANALRQQELPPWSADEIRTQEEQARRAFDATSQSARDPDLGKQLIFIVGLPRTGTTLVEQVLASHAEVEGGGELPALPQVLTEESTRLRRRYPEWVPDATADDWQRLGERYLELTAGQRVHKPRSTDKLPSNWRHIGAIRAMLPAARIVVCRRDPLETCWSCFKLYFPDSGGYVNDLNGLGVLWNAFDRAASRWADVAAGSLRSQSYEALTENPEREISSLLAFCGLSFEPACLKSHESRRRVHTLSSAQVREPVYRHRSIARQYGDLLDPLRDALGLARAATEARGSQSGEGGAGK